MKNRKKPGSREDSKRQKSCQSNRDESFKSNHRSSNSRDSIPKKSSFKQNCKPREQTSKKTSKKNAIISQSVNEEERRNFLPGQKYKTPDEESGALAFYRSLYEQNPQSEMARRYCIENGMLEYNEAKRVLQQLAKTSKTKPKK